jgi:hypothetical protein
MNGLSKAIITLLTLVLITRSFAVVAKPKVKDVRWSYITNIVRYITWPQAKVNPVISICVVGKSPFISLEQGTGRDQKTGYITAARHYEQIPDIGVLRRCSAIYFSKSITLPQLSFVFSKLESLPILTIGDHRAFLRIGGLLQFAKQGNKLRFKLNKSLLNDMTLKVHPSLLRLSD